MKGRRLNWSWPWSARRKARTERAGTPRERQMRMLKSAAEQESWLKQLRRTWRLDKGKPGGPDDPDRA